MQTRTSSVTISSALAAKWCASPRSLRCAIGVRCHSARGPAAAIVCVSIFWLCLFWAPVVQAATADAELEAQVQRVAAELRCLVCQNQTLADSHAELARDLRAQVREMLASGKSEAQVREFMVARYGDFVLYRPPFKTTTLLLWFGPFVLLLAGIWALRRIAIGRRRTVADGALSDEEQARLRAIVAGAENEAR
ncbi:MAG: cytochrome c-type biogenesis protein CcmH [Burkholderiales bacterium]|nr:cytochrome c-type biogenesis protein CcmH [Burkholderiales bacterium]